MSLKSHLSTAAFNIISCAIGIFIGCALSSFWDLASMLNVSHPHDRGITNLLLLCALVQLIIVLALLARRNAHVVNKAILGLWLILVCTVLAFILI
ncbi:hypothetical protein EV197_2606 [Aquimarina brevivitae]|uniref:Uncharacterized protein n=1 Tax=Aquimarina brevivitae TaxID=323412 RepID=A0A4Q7NZM8_9FLAO|nr:hypothetical protein EV197_2606 [Aquimarina brevivitae]